MPEAEDEGEWGFFDLQSIDDSLSGQAEIPSRDLDDVPVLAEPALLAGASSHTDTYGTSDFIGERYIYDIPELDPQDQPLIMPPPKRQRSAKRARCRRTMSESDLSHKSPKHIPDPDAQMECESSVDRLSEYFGRSLGRSKSVEDLTAAFMSSQKSLWKEKNGSDSPFKLETREAMALMAAASKMCKQPRPLEKQTHWLNAEQVEKVRQAARSLLLPLIAVDSETQMNLATRLVLPVDTTGDGICDSMAVDTNRDGSPDRVLVALDSSGDGYADLWATICDSGAGNGPDCLVVHPKMQNRRRSESKDTRDFDEEEDDSHVIGEGEPYEGEPYEGEPYNIAIPLDSNGDGIPDKLAYLMDTTGDCLFDSLAVTNAPNKVMRAAAQNAHASDAIATLLVPVDMTRRCTFANRWGLRVNATQVKVTLGNGEDDIMFRRQFKMLNPPLLSKVCPWLDAHIHLHPSVRMTEWQAILSTQLQDKVNNMVQAIEKKKHGKPKKDRGPVKYMREIATQCDTSITGRPPSLHRHPPEVMVD